MALDRFWFESVFLFDIVYQYMSPIHPKTIHLKRARLLEYIA